MAKSRTAEGPGRPAAKMTWAEIAFQSRTASALAETVPASSTASVIRMRLCFIIFDFFLCCLATNARFVVQVTRRFPRLNHDTGFEYFFEQRWKRCVERGRQAPSGAEYSSAN